METYEILAELIENISDEDWCEYLTEYFSCEPEELEDELNSCEDAGEIRNLFYDFC